LEDNDFAKSSWSEPKDGKAPKKYYEITKKGRERLLFQKEHWTLFEKKVDELLRGNGK
jgi:DNA-binding PadR family transcriptional regulator